jgi:acetyl-CoA synthetase
MLPDAPTYDEMTARFRWAIPARYNIAEAVCDRWAARLPTAPAILEALGDGMMATTTFRQLQQRANRLANALAALGVGRGARVGILLPQMSAAAVAHIATYKLGAVAVPLFTLFGPDALHYRLADSAAKVVIGTPDALATLDTAEGELPDLAARVAVGGAAPGAHDFETLLARASDSFETVDTAAADPALVIYTSGTTGQPKGALHAHRVLPGHLPGVELPQGLFPKRGDLFWTPADWAWIGGLLDVLLPSLAHGVPVVAKRFPKFDPEAAFDLMARVGVRNAFMPPTALKMMRQVPNPAARHDLCVRSIGSGGETLGADLLDWGREVFGVSVNEFYGQTECNLIVANCADLMPVKPGSMGRPVPGHEVAILNDAGERLPEGEPGTVAVRRPDPAMFLEYLNKPEATAAKFRGDWLLTGDTASMDADGYVWFQGREDDIITTGGYRVGPTEIEAGLTAHPAVAMAAVVGVPDPLRGERVKAFIVPAEGWTPDAALTAELQDRIKTRVAKHAYPREIEYVPALPLTATGKIRRKALREGE